MTRINAKRAVERCELLAKLGSPPPWWRVLSLRRWLRAYRSIMAMDISEMGEMLRAEYPASDIAAHARRPNPIGVERRAILGKWVGPR